MRLLCALILSLILSLTAATAQEKPPRDDEKKRDDAAEKPAGKLEHAKDELKRKKQKSERVTNDDEDDVWSDLVFHILINTIPDGFSYAYAQYPYYEEGLYVKGSPGSRPVYIVGEVSGFSGLNDIKGKSLGLKLKLFTGFGFDYDYVALEETYLAQETSLKMHSYAAALNFLTDERGSLEIKFGARKVIDIGTSPLVGFELDIAPVSPVIANLQIGLAKINGHNMNDYRIGIGYCLRQLEMFAGFKQENLGEATVRGPEIGLRIRL